MPRRTILRNHEIEAIVDRNDHRDGVTLSLHLSHIHAQRESAFDAFADILNTVAIGNYLAPRAAAAQREFFNQVRQSFGRDFANTAEEGVRGYPCVICLDLDTRPGRENGIRLQYSAYSAANGFMNNRRNLDLRGDLTEEQQHTLADNLENAFQGQVRHL